MTAAAVSNSSPLPQTQQGGVGSSNISRVFPVKKPHMSPIFIEEEPKEPDIPPQQMPELIADQHAIKKSGKIYFMLECLKRNESEFYSIIRTKKDDLSKS